MFSWLFWWGALFCPSVASLMKSLKMMLKLVFSDLTEISLEEATSGKYRMFQGDVFGYKRANRWFWAAFCYRTLLQRFSGVRSQPVIYEAMPLGTTKATALSRLAEILNIEPSEIMAMGDANNDIEMLQFAGLGIAMGNASDYVKSSCGCRYSQQRRRRCCACHWEVYFIIKRPSSCQLGFDI